MNVLTLWISCTVSLSDPHTKIWTHQVSKDCWQNCSPWRSLANDKKYMRHSVLNQSQICPKEKCRTLGALKKRWCQVRFYIWSIPIRVGRVRVRRFSMALGSFCSQSWHLSFKVWNLVNHLRQLNEVLLLLTHVGFRFVSHARLGLLVTKYWQNNQNVIISFGCWWSYDWSLMTCNQ